MKTDYHNVTINIMMLIGGFC